MPTPRVLVLRAPGTNCDCETAFAFEQAGAAATPLHINQLLDQPDVVREFQILCLPGGFSYGDDVAAGRILANQIRHHLQDTMREFQTAGKLVLGICNGFQVLIKAGILLADDPQGPLSTLTWNDSGRFEDRWIHLQASHSNCVFLSGIDSMYLPVAHAEGKFMLRDAAKLKQLEVAGQLVLRYSDPRSHGPGGNGTSSVPYPHNPNGSQANVAGVCDGSGRVFGLMPHPERYTDPTHHPHWTREMPEKGDGQAIFENAVRYFA